MPCGGIFPIKLDGNCLVCGKGNSHHFIEEWDAFIHARCAIKALNDSNSEVYVVILHEHEVCLDFSLEGEEQLDDPR